jgi:hypothetical protein
VLWSVKQLKPGVLLGSREAGSYFDAMKKPCALGRLPAGFSLIVAIAFIVAGCATGPRIDWNARIGTYTYDQAILELGPPDKEARLTDGTRVAEWLTFRGRGGGYMSGFAGPVFYRPYYFYGPPPFYYAEPPSPDRFLRLTFSPDGRLFDWNRVYR